MTSYWLLDMSWQVSTHAPIWHAIVDCQIFLNSKVKVGGFQNLEKTLLDHMLTYVCHQSQNSRTLLSRVAHSVAREQNEQRAAISAQR